MKARFACAVLVAVFVSPVTAMFIRPQEVPVERLLKNAESYRTAHPESADADYIIARIHYLAFARKSNAVPATSEADNEGKPRIAPNWMIGPIKPGNTLEAKEMAAHATAALKGFRELVKKSPDNGLYHLGLASLLEQIADWKDNDKPAELTAAVQEVNRTQARDAYLAACRAAYPADAKLTHQPVSGINSLVSVEAGHGFVRLAGDDPKLAKEVKEVQEILQKISALPRGPITPVVFSLQHATRIAGLLDPAVTVDFDLRGYGVREKTTWLQPTTGLLVWDPDKQASITSGRQLFGGYTFQIFRANGYDALAALDDDANGVLTGTELTGIRAWFDNNQDGKSSAAEVRDLTDIGVAGIAVQADAHDGPHPTNPKGLIMRDGSTLPTWDWMVKP